MPSRVFVPISGIDPRTVQLEHLHAATSGWFDGCLAEHHANAKPYVVSPMTHFAGRVGLEVGLLNKAAHERLVHRIADGSPVRFGRATGRLGAPVPMWSAGWRRLAEARHRRWQVDLLTPTTFRSGDRSSPLPVLATILSDLYRIWSQWADLAVPDPAEARGAVWVSDLDLASRTVPVRITGADRQRRTVNVSAALGSFTIRCDDDNASAAVAPLFALAPYCGMGSMRGRGLGVVRVATSPSVGAVRGRSTA